MNYAVIIPAYNAASSILRAVASCLHQTVAPAQIFIVNDASTDDTKAIIDGIDHPLVTCIHLDTNQGVSAARNAGWAAATTDYVAMLDSDDEWLPNKMEVCMQYFATHPNVILGHGFRYPDEGKISLENTSTRIKKISTFQILLANPFVTCAVVFPRNIFLRYDETMRYCEDHDLLLRASFHHSIFAIPHALSIVHRRLNSPGGLSGQRWEMRKGELKMYRKLPAHYMLLKPLLFMYSIIKHILKHCRN